MKTKECIVCKKLKYLRAFRKVFGKHYLKTCKQCEKNKEVNPPEKEVSLGIIPVIEGFTREEVEKLIRFGEGCGILSLATVIDKTITKTKKAIETLQKARLLTPFPLSNKEYLHNRPRHERTIFYTTKGSLKMCPNCENIMPYSEFPINLDTFGRVEHSCKDCIEEKARQEVKTCKVCWTTKPESDFASAGDSDVRIICKECLKAQEKAKRELKRLNASEEKIDEQISENVLEDEMPIPGIVEIKGEPGDRKVKYFHPKTTKKYPVSEEKIYGIPEVKPEERVPFSPFVKKTPVYTDAEIEKRNYEEAKAFIYLLEIFNFQEKQPSVSTEVTTKIYEDIRNNTHNPQIKAYLDKLLNILKVLWG